MRTWLFIAAALVGGCASSTAPDPGLEGLSITKVAPGTIIPGTKILVKGASFVDEHWGAGTLRLVGKAGSTDVDESWPATFVDFSTLSVPVDGAKIDKLGGTADFSGRIWVEFVAESDGNTYKTGELTQDLHFRKTLTPNVTGLVDGLHFINDEIAVDGDGFLLGGDEGTTYARITGCYTLDGTSSCVPVSQLDIPLVPRTELSRTQAQFPFSPKIAGIRPGEFVGNVTIVNKQAAGAEVPATAQPVDYTIVTAQVFSTDPGAASLGQYVFIRGGGFVGGENGALTELELKGQFNKTGMAPVSVTMDLIPEFVDGPLVRYVLNTDDELGQAVDLRTDTGHFSGTIMPIIHYGGATVNGQSSPMTFDIAPVRQVVHLDFTPSYVEGLRDFGLRAVDARIRDRIVTVLNRTYQGVNMDFRVDPVTDFALYEDVTMMGVDPNSMGLFGYDNSEGKDNGNLRLYDKLGGVNAATQQDGYPGFGGVFLRSLFGFSKHPGSFATSVPGADDLFDKTFDSFRPDRSGNPVTSSDLSGTISVLTDGSQCPASDRAGKIECAIFVLGNLVGGTLSHEIGHSLGLANPYAEGFHDSGDGPARLMDAGGDRPFLERAELKNTPPGVFCDDEYSYLRQILPKSEAPPAVERPSCF